MFKCDEVFKVDKVKNCLFKKKNVECIKDNYKNKIFIILKLMNGFNIYSD